MPGHEILSSDEIEADLLKVAEDLSKEAAPWKNKLLAPALGLGMALAPGAAQGQQPKSNQPAVHQQVKKPTTEQAVKYINDRVRSVTFSLKDTFLEFDNNKQSIDLLKVKDVTIDETGMVVMFNFTDGTQSEGFIVEGEDARVANALNYLIKIVKEQAKKDPFAKPIGSLEKEAAPSWRQKMLAPALGLGMALSPGAAPAQAQQPAAQTQQSSAWRLDSK